MRKLNGHGSNISKQNIIGSFVPVVFFSIIVRSRPRHHTPDVLDSGVAALESCGRLELLSLLLLSVFVLDFLNDVVIVEFFLSLRGFFESVLADSETRFFDNQIRVIFFFFDHSRGDVQVVDVVHSWSWV